MSCLQDELPHLDATHLHHPAHDSHHIGYRNQQHVDRETRRAAQRLFGRCDSVFSPNLRVSSSRSTHGGLSGSRRDPFGPESLWKGRSQIPVLRELGCERSVWVRNKSMFSIVHPSQTYMGNNSNCSERMSFETNRQTQDMDH